MVGVAFRLTLAKKSLCKPAKHERLNQSGNVPLQVQCCVFLSPGLPFVLDGKAPAQGAGQGGVHLGGGVIPDKEPVDGPVSLLHPQQQDVPGRSTGGQGQGGAKRKVPMASRPARQAPVGTPGRFSSTARGWVKLPPSPMNSSTVG